MTRRDSDYWQRVELEDERRTRRFTYGIAGIVAVVIVLVTALLVSLSR